MLCNVSCAMGKFRVEKRKCVFCVMMMRAFASQKCNLMFAVHIHNLMLKMLLFQNGNIRT